jgi:hypothetical protein
LESNSSRKVYKLATMLLMVVGFCLFIIASNPKWTGWIEDKIDFLPDILRQTGLAMFVSSLILLLLRGVQTEAIKLIIKEELERSHDDKCKKEHDGLDQQHKTITKEIVKILDLTESGLDRIYPNRHDKEAVADVIKQLVNLKLDEASNSKKLLLMGCTLKVFFKDGQDFRKDIYYIEEILNQKNSECNIEMLVLNPYCPEAMYRSHIEQNLGKDGFENLDHYEKYSGLYKDSQKIRSEYQTLKELWPNKIELKYYHEGNSMLLFCFSAVVYVQQYTFAPLKLGHRMPFMRFTKTEGDGIAYELMKNHFVQLWKTADTFDTVGKMNHEQKIAFFNKYRELVDKKNNCFC